MTSHVVVADGENLAHNKFIHAEGAGMKQFIHSPMADINESVQYYALEDSIINKWPIDCLFCDLWHIEWQYLMTILNVVNVAHGLEGSLISKRLSFPSAIK